MAWVDALGRGGCAGDGWGVGGLEGKGGEWAGLASLKRGVFLDSELQTRAGAVWPEGVELCSAWNCSVPFFLVRCVSHAGESESVRLGCVWLGLSHSGHTAPQRQTVTDSDRIMVSYTTSELRVMQRLSRCARW